MANIATALNAGPPSIAIAIGFVIVVLALIGWNLWFKYGGRGR